MRTAYNDHFHKDIFFLLISPAFWVTAVLILQPLVNTNISEWNDSTTSPVLEPDATVCGGMSQRVPLLPQDKGGQLLSSLSVGGRWDKEKRNIQLSAWYSAGPADMQETNQNIDIRSLKQYSTVLISLHHKCNTSYLRDDKFKGWLELLNVSSQTIHQLSSFIGIIESHILPETKRNKTMTADVVHPWA